MARRKTFDVASWAASVERPSACRTCRLGWPIRRAIEEYAGLPGDLRSRASLNLFHAELAQRLGYPHTVEALRLHIKKCLGGSREDRTRRPSGDGPA